MCGIHYTDILRFSSNEEEKKVYQNNNQHGTCLAVCVAAFRFINAASKKKIQGLQKQIKIKIIANHSHHMVFRR